jgi:hypothetical protein
MTETTTPTVKASVMDNQDLIRLEGKIDEVADAIKSLIIIEERQANQTTEITNLKKRVEDMGVEQGTINRRIDRLVNLVLGGWAVIVVLFEVYKAIKGV